MLKWENQNDSSEEGNYILPDLCSVVKEESEDSQSEDKICEEPAVHFFKTECPDYSSDDDNSMPLEQCEIDDNSMPLEQCEIDDNSMPLEQCEITVDAAGDSLPDKSKKLYKETYLQFLNWLEEKEIKLCSEHVLLEYFKELSTKMSPISLWPKYSMLRAMLNQEKNIDIKNYTQLRLFLKKINIGVRCKRAKTFSAEEMVKFLTEASDEQNLDLKVLLIVGVAGSCRRKELHDLRVKHVKDVDSQLLISLPDAKTRGVRIISLTNSLREILIKYMNLRPRDIEDDHFFLNYQKGKCTKQLIGINKIGTTPQKIATWLELPFPKLYTGHSFRTTPASLLNDAAAIMDSLKPSAESLPREVAEDYEEHSIDEKNHCNQITEEFVDEQSYDSEDTVEDVLPEKSKKLYKETYALFVKWMEENQNESYSENVLLDYFKELSTKMAPISLWPKYSMLRAMINKKKNIDIRNYTQLRYFLKNLNIGVRCKQAKTFTSEEMRKFLTEAPDEQHLDLKVILIIGVTGACSRKELHDLRINQVKDVNNQLVVSLPDAKTRGTRTFIVNNALREIVKKYMNLRPRNVTDDHFFLNYQKGKCTKQLIGINKIGAMPHRIAEWLNLPHPNLYTVEIRNETGILVGDERKQKRLSLEKPKKLFTEASNK